MPDEAYTDGDRQTTAVQEIEVINEFAAVVVRKVLTRNGVRLEISSPRLGHSIKLDALALEGLTWQPMETFTRFLETPFGPWELDARGQNPREEDGKA